jgi:hypothetical protein
MDDPGTDASARARNRFRRRSTARCGTKNGKHRDDEADPMVSLCRTPVPHRPDHLSAFSCRTSER